MQDEREPMTISRDDEGKRPPEPQNWKERIYERMRMPLWVLDLIICLLVTLFIVVVLIGILHGNARSSLPAAHKTPPASVSVPLQQRPCSYITRTSME